MTLPPAPPIKGLWHAALHVRDLAAMRRFYVELLGYAVEWEPDPANLYLTRGRDNLALHESADGPAPGEARGVLDHLGFVLHEPEHVDGWAARLTAAGFPPEQAPRTHRDGARSFYVRDPEHNLLQFIHHPPLHDA
jgi:catechol 2,3-dioxygenase-like lactoylglutathione lyase family enzyme